MKYGLIGERLGHSFSKIIHEQLADYEYELRELASDQLDEFMRRRDFLGINVTMPYKESVIPYLDEIDGAAGEIGAVNTVVNRDGRLYGYNTDFYGLRKLFTKFGIEVEGKKAVILGTGATSKTAAAVLRSLNVGRIVNVSRSPQKKSIGYDDLYRDHTDADVIVNTTPVGMYKELFASPVDLATFKKLTAYVDVIFNPLRTEAMLDAQSKGISAVGGLYMLVEQAVRASEIFLDTEYPEGTTDDIYSSILKDKENIILIGMPSSGKSTVGEIIARRLGRPFIDTDQIITEEIGMSIKDFFTLHGEEEFRRIESRVITRLAPAGSAVISTGGGAVLRKENLRCLRYNGRIYFIDRPLEYLIPTDSRPLSQTKEAIERLYNERYPIYCRECDEKIVADCDTDGVADKILEKHK